MRMRPPRPHPLLLLIAWALLPLSGCADPEATARVSHVQGAKVPEGALESTHVRTVSTADLGRDLVDLTTLTRVFVDAQMGDGDGQGEFEIEVETEIDPDDTVPWHPEAAFGGAPDAEPL